MATKAAAPPALAGFLRWPAWALAVLANPIRPFTFAAQTWRLLHAGAGLWLAADHVPGRDRVQPAIGTP